MATLGDKVYTTSIYEIGSAAVCAVVWCVMCPTVLAGGVSYILCSPYGRPQGRTQGAFGTLSIVNICIL